ncbi:MAG: hypothetical protein IPN68_16820 [Bacteroidetes bacterium]|nr:hypothetical protein [Bacteroidota bacterium]
MKIFIPSKLSLQTHFQKYPPPRINKFSEIKLALLLSQIIVVSANNKKTRDQDGFVSLSSSMLQRMVREYRQYLDYSRDTGIIQEKSQFIVNKKCRHFRFHPKFDSKLKVYPIGNYRLPKFVRENFSHNISLPKKYQFLALPFESGELRIAYRPALDFIERQLNYYLQHPDEVPTYRVTGSIFRRRKRPIDQFNSAMYNLDRLVVQDYHMNIDDTAGRCHSNLTNMPSLLRHFLTYGGESLVSIDVSGSQPYIMNMLLHPSFYIGGKNFSFSQNIELIEYEYKSGRKTNQRGLRIDQLSTKMEKEIVRSKEDASTIITLVNQGQTLASKEFQRYRNITTSGKFYTYLQKGLSRDVNSEFGNLKEVKVEVLRIFFSSNTFFKQEAAKPKQWFAKNFSTIYDITHFYKQYNKSYFPTLLQRAEAEVMLNRVARRISHQKLNIPCFTVHD